MNETAVVLLGDAAYTLSLMSGQGASMAIIGAQILAEELGRSSDHVRAFAAYERRLRPVIAPLQTQAFRCTQAVVPANPLTIDVLNLWMRYAPDWVIERQFAGAVKQQV
jgi:2-polyprenyl-6-methoxyphenol hydroxylase-like FAD-dependent oxidoreductase